MFVTCPECQFECSFDETSVETATCPGCGHLLYSRSGDSGQLLAELDANRSLNEHLHLEETRLWKQSVEVLLPVPEQLPRKLGKYLLTQSLGTGSFSQVYLATDTELGRQVALKIPRRDRFRSAEHLLRFLDEARLTAKLEHPGIVRVYDIGWLADEVCFIAMEYFPGGSLDQKIKTEKLTHARAAEITADVAEAIHFAHLAGLVHRDLKPSNIMLGNDDRPRLVDFGLALSEDQQSQRAGEIAGTIPYMSPEQVRGEAHRLEGRSDIWSLGVILYLMLTGRRPFQGQRQLLFDDILNREPKPLRQIDDSIPADLEAICLRCLEKEVTRRWTTAKDLANALRHWVDDVGLARPTQIRPPRRDWRSKLTAVGPLALALAVFSVGGVLAFTLKPTNSGKASSVVGISSLPSLDDSPLHRVIPLIDESRVPQKLSWPVPGIDDSFSYDLSEGRVSLQNRSTGFIELGTTNADEIVLEAEFSRTPGRGANGLFFGWQPHPTKPGYHDCFAVVTTTTIDQKRQLKYHLSVELLRLQDAPNNQHQIIETAGLTGQALELDLHPNRGRLTVHVSGTLGLQAILWEGRELANLPPKAHAFLKSQPQRFPFVRSAGRFGVFNRYGGILVRNPTIRIERRANAPTLPKSK